MKLDKRFTPYIFATVMAIAMGFFMSLFLTAINTGIESGFIFRWMKSFGVAIFVGFPVSLLVAPFAQEIVLRLTKE
ncbi:DUF2798 domain-containing protein [Thermodesulfobacteriota bacterium]